MSEKQDERSAEGSLAHPDQLRLTRAALREIGAQIQRERLTRIRPVETREALGYTPHPDQPRLSGAEVRAQISALARELDARRTEMAQENVEPTERLHLRERGRGYSY